MDVRGQPRCWSSFPTVTETRTPLFAAVNDRQAGLCALQVLLCLLILLYAYQCIQMWASLPAYVSSGESGTQVPMLIYQGFYQLSRLLGPNLLFEAGFLIGLRAHSVG